MKKIGVGGVLLLLLLSAAGTFLPIGRRSHFTCIDRGLYFQDRVLFGLSLPKHERRQRTDWYDRRIGAAHAHRWTKSSCTAGLNLWQQPTSFACGKQEPLDLDLKYHQELAHPRPDHREAAAETWNNFDPKWKDDEVLRWWEKTSADLASRFPRSITNP